VGRQNRTGGIQRKYLAGDCRNRSIRRSSMVRRACAFLIREGPITAQDRWEEASGYSPSTLAAHIAALICGAEFLEDRGDKSSAEFVRDYADFLETHIERWTVTTQGTLVPGTKRHYSGNPEVIIIASGSELSLAVDAHETLIGEGIRSRVVSMPSWEIFDHESKEYRDSVFPPAVTARVAVEQASTLGWERYVGTSGRVIGMHTFGASAPLKELQRKFGFEPGQVAAAAREQLRQT